MSFYSIRKAPILEENYFHDRMLFTFEGFRELYPDIPTDLYTAVHDQMNQINRFDQPLHMILAFLSFLKHNLGCLARINAQNELKLTVNNIEHSKVDEEIEFKYPELPPFGFVDEYKKDLKSQQTFNENLYIILDSLSFIRDVSERFCHLAFKEHRQYIARQTQAQELAQFIMYNQARLNPLPSHIAHLVSEILNHSPTADPRPQAKDIENIENIEDIEEQDLYEKRDRETIHEINRLITADKIACTQQEDFFAIHHEQDLDYQPAPVQPEESRGSNRGRDHGRGSNRADNTGSKSSNLLNSIFEKLGRKPVDARSGIRNKADETRQVGEKKSKLGEDNHDGDDDDDDDDDDNNDQVVQHENQDQDQDQDHAHRFYIHGFKKVKTETDSRFITADQLLPARAVEHKVQNTRPTTTKATRMVAYNPALRMDLPPPPPPTNLLSTKSKTSFLDFQNSRASNPLREKHCLGQIATLNDARPSRAEPNSQRIELFSSKGELEAIITPGNGDGSGSASVQEVCIDYVQDECTLSSQNSDYIERVRHDGFSKTFDQC